MKVFVDIFSEQEVISDAYKLEYVYNKAGVEVRSNFITIPDNSVLDDGQERNEDGQKVLDVVNQFQYNEVLFTQKDFDNFIKLYMSKVRNHLLDHNPERVQDFVNCALDMASKIRADFHKYTFYSLSDNVTENIIIISYYKVQNDDAPTFFYFTDGLKIIGE